MKRVEDMTRREWWNYIWPITKAAIRGKDLPHEASSRGKGFGEQKDTMPDSNAGRLGL